MIKEAIVKIVSKGDLTYEEAYTVMNEIMSGETTATRYRALEDQSAPKNETLRRSLLSDGRLDDTITLCHRISTSRISSPRQSL